MKKKCILEVSCCSRPTWSCSWTSCKTAWGGSPSWQHLDHVVWDSCHIYNDLQNSYNSSGSDRFTAVYPLHKQMPTMCAAFSHCRPSTSSSMPFKPACRALSWTKVHLLMWKQLLQMTPNLRFNMVQQMLCHWQSGQVQWIKMSTVPASCWGRPMLARKAFGMQRSRYSQCIL